MAFKLLVFNASEAAPQPEAFIFHQDRVVLGRDPGCDLPLADDKRIISKQHATITATGPTYHLTDLGSKNFTYLNGDRLASGQPHELKPGDTIQIGSYKLTLEPVGATPQPAAFGPADADRTVFDVSFVNPFEDDAKLVAATMRSIRKVYEEVMPSRREDALQDALRAAIGDAGDHEADALLARLIGGATWSSPRPAPAPIPTAREAAPPIPTAREVAPPVAAPPVAAPPAPPAPAIVLTQADAPRLHRLVDTILRSFSKLIGTPWQFRYEFIGQTIMQPENAAFLYEGNAEALKHHLLAPSIAEETFAERLELLEAAADDLALHQVALIDGYRAGVEQGAGHLLDQIDPEAVRAEVARESFLHRMAPPLVAVEVLKRIGAQLDELRREDWSAVERRTYRPAFVKAYLARMTSIRRQRDASAFP